jgi:NAD(P)-dependent dehydrogenase (short-subunit alcohol dehydrogenase family)
MNALKKVAVVTGCSSGIGKTITNRLLSEDWFVYGIDLAAADEGEDRANFRLITVDLTDFKALATACEGFELSLERNILVNCAGIREICSIDDLSIELWTKVISLNVTSVFCLSKWLERRIRDSGARFNIVNIASVSGLLGEPNRTAYVTSKHAILGLTKQLAIEYGAFGVRVNAVSPGVIRTPLTEAYFSDPQQMQKIQTGQFLAKTGQTDDVANAVLYLASDQAGFVTGSNFVIDGGWSAGKVI